MWANKCTWDHGFLEFGDVYPNAPFKGQVGMWKNGDIRTMRFLDYNVLRRPIPCGPYADVTELIFSSHVTQQAWGELRLNENGVDR